MLAYIFIRLRIIMHPYSYKGYYRVNREIISRFPSLCHSVVDMKQSHVEDDTMPFEQGSVRQRNRPFMLVSNDTNHDSDDGNNWYI